MNLQSTGNLLGIPLRPWAGMAPGRLALHGLVHTAIGIFVVFWCVRIAGGYLAGETGEVAAMAGTIQKLAIPAAIFFVLFTLYGMLRLAVGILDFVPRREVSGVVVMTGARQFGDALPRFVQNLIWSRDRNGQPGYDNRRTRHELVLETPSGLKTFTVKPGMALSAHRGQHVRLSVSPLIGYVAKCQVVAAG